MRTRPDHSLPGGEAPAAWLDELCHARSAFDLPRQAHHRAGQVVEQVLGFLFPHFAPEVHCEREALAREYRELAEVTFQLLSAFCGEERARAAVGPLLDGLPALHAALTEDARFILASDPAATSLDEVILAYPGFLATACYRIAHRLRELEIPLLPRLITEYAHQRTGIDIHPGATIGVPFAIDHGTGTVIGETAHVGARVRMYQGVTLGALSVEKRLASAKRHPTIGDDVVLYANATVLGGRTIVGEGSVIGGNVWLTRSVPERTVVAQRAMETHATDDPLLEFYI
ncbi:MAG: serine O-acetyltransferase [Gemmatimonadaceae bacterium]